MNTDGSKKEHEYLEDISRSAEYMFATYASQYATSATRIPYFDAVNIVGKKIFPTQWTGREFFARKGHSDVAAFQGKREMFYKLFYSPKEEGMAAARNLYAEFPVLTALKSGELRAYFINHRTGEETLIEVDYWRSGKSHFTRSRATYPSPDRLSRPEVPGVDFAVSLNLQEFKKVIKTMPKKIPRKRQPPDKDLITQARKLVIEMCEQNSFMLDRKIYFKALNHLLDTDYFNDNSIRPYWKKDIPKHLKNVKRVKDCSYIPLEALPKPLIS